MRELVAVSVMLATCVLINLTVSSVMESKVVSSPIAAFRSLSLPLSLSSPSETRVLLLHSFKDCVFNYSVEHRGAIVLGPVLWTISSGGGSCNASSVLMGISTHDEWSGIGEAQSSYVSSFVEIQVSYSAGTAYFRVYDNSVTHRIAYRAFDGETSSSTLVPFPPCATGIFDRGNEWGYSIVSPNNETELEALSQDWRSTLQQLPFLLDQTNCKSGELVSVLEACSLRFRNMIQTLHPNAIELSVSRSDIPTEIVLPWHVYGFGKNPTTLLNNALHPGSLCPDPEKNFNWVIPGKVVRDIRISDESFSELAPMLKSAGYDYILVDAGWYGNEYSKHFDPRIPLSNPKNGSFDMTRSVDLAKEHGLGVILYVNDIGLIQYGAESVLDTIAGWGVSGVKFGFVNVSTNMNMERILDYVRMAGERKLVVNIHDNFRTFGIERTFPHLLSVEGVRGDEHEDNTVKHHLLVPMIRTLAGRTDFTFTMEWQRLAAQGKSLMFQVAYPIIVPNGLQFLFWYLPWDILKDRGLTTAPFNLWSEMPNQWIASQVLSAQLGKKLMIARRSSETKWFIAAVSAVDTHILLRLSDLTGDMALPPRKTFTLAMYQDSQVSIGSTSAKSIPDFKLDTTTITSSKTIQFELLSGQGVLMTLTQT